MQATTTYQSNDTIRVATTVEMEFDDSSEAAMLRNCDEADRTKFIPECHPSVNKFRLLDLNKIKLQNTKNCKQKWRAKCNHVRNGGLLTNPPPTTMIMPESNTTSIVWTTSKDDSTANVITEFDDSPEADAIRKCDEADRTGDIPECTWVRKF